MKLKIVMLDGNEHVLTCKALLSVDGVDYTGTVVTDPLQMDARLSTNELAIQRIADCQEEMIERLNQIVIAMNSSEEENHVGSD